MTGSSADSNNQKESNLQLSHFENGSWTNVTTSLNTTTNRICGLANSFSYYTILEIDESPVIGEINAPTEPLLAQTSMNASVSFTDVNVTDSHTSLWYWGDGSNTEGIITENQGTGSVTGNHTYVTPGVYVLAVVISDSSGSAGDATYEYIVVYDTNGGFVTGGGQILSPPGAYLPNLNLTGDAHFGFISKYQNGANVPTGQTQFRFQVADLRFKSTEYQWLVVAGPQAKYKGLGTINGNGNYGFLLSAVDGQTSGGGGVDKFRIKIWDKDNGDTLVYDNHFDALENLDPVTALTQGQIQIQY